MRHSQEESTLTENQVRRFAEGTHRAKLKATTVGAMNP